MKQPEFNNREEEARYWDSHNVFEFAPEEEHANNELEVKKPLTHVLSVRIDSDDMRKLEYLAKVQGVGVTTMARVLLRQVLARPNYQLVLQALEQRNVREEIEKLNDDSVVPAGGNDPSFLIISSHRLQEIVKAINEGVQALLTDAAKESTRISPADELYPMLEKMAPK